MTPASEPPARVVFSVTMGVSTSAALGRRSQVFTIEDCWTIGICEAARRELRHPTLLMGEASQCPSPPLVPHLPVQGQGFVVQRNSPILLAPLTSVLPRMRIA
jgi:hypothetical protein